MDAQTSRQSAPQDEQAIVAWLQQNAIPLRHIEAGNGFADLQPLKRILADARVVGLGETTHGTREFFQIKHRLLEFLVTEMAFNAFVLEASYAACQPINEYVLHGRGDRATVLTGQGYIPWDTEEFSEMLDWLRAYNQGVPDEKKVSFHGADLWRNEMGRQGGPGLSVQRRARRSRSRRLAFRGSREKRRSGPGGSTRKPSECSEKRYPSCKT